jgi:predicted TIM-barrel fold metal-dependent hydrolase
MIIDAHQHVGDLSDALSFDGTGEGTDLDIAEDARRRVAHMDALNVRWAILQPSHAYLRPDGITDTMRVNDRMALYPAYAPGRFCVLGTTEPMYGRRGLLELDRFQGLGLRGVAWHHRFQGCFIDSRWMWPTLERMGELGLVPLVHVNAESSMEAHWRLQRLAQDFPDLPFLAMDGLWTYERARHALMTAHVTPNVIWDMGGPVCYISAQEWVERNGSASLCFSTGMSYPSKSLPQRPALLGHIESADISEADKANILGGNLERLFSLG